MILDWFRRRGRWKGGAQDPPPDRHGINAKYTRFQDLLTSNADLLAIIVGFEEKLCGKVPFTLHEIRTQARSALRYTRRMVEDLNSISGVPQAALMAALDRIATRIRQQTDPVVSAAPVELVVPHALISRESAEWVGGKNAQLGEMRNRIGLPVPAGFAVTTAAYHLFLKQNELDRYIREELAGLDVTHSALLEAVSEKIQRRILSAPVPPEMAQQILGAYDELWPNRPPDLPPRIAMRSSAAGEDGELSFAGQYRSVLNVTRDRLIPDYVLVVASLYSPRAIAYRFHLGVAEEGLAMAVACLQMVESVASGVVYSAHPHDPEPAAITISAVWGLGPFAVDGRISPDLYTVAMQDDLAILQKTIADKQIQLVCAPEGGLREIPVPENRRRQACLSDAQIQTLGGYALRLAGHYGCAQDAEWALTEAGEIVLLQTRPLKRVETRPQARISSAIPGRDVLLEGGAVAVAGVARGPAFHVRNEDDLAAFPEGAVLVARHSSPRYVVVMHKAAAMLTDAGSITGHMAALCREFGIPSLLNTKTATQAIGHGELITVDAQHARIYRGTVPELEGELPTGPRCVLNSPLSSELRRLAELITPLNLLDPHSAGFQPENCATLHDVARFVHERSYQAMFRISEDASGASGQARKLVAALPLDLYLIDLGGGLSAAVNPARRSVTVEQVVSVPLQALLAGLLDAELLRRQPRAVDLGGFLSVMQAQLRAGEGTLGDRSYAIISEKYLNFSSRVGYHYSILDTYCGRTINKNYITFRFKGGAADDARRNRRARVIARILGELDFTVEMKEDQVDARFQKYDRGDTAGRLTLLGRLLQFTRQLDMLMTDEGSVDRFVQAFLRGDYRYDGSSG